MASDAVRQLVHSVTGKCVWQCQEEHTEECDALTKGLQEVVLAAEAAAIEECADICEAQRQKILSRPDDPSWTEHLAEAQSAMRSLLTPARKSALEAKVLEARKQEHIEQEWERLWPPEKDKSICAWGPKCVRCAELDRQLASLRKENGNETLNNYGDWI